MRNDGFFMKLFKCTVHSTQYTVYSLQDTVYSVQCTVHKKNWPKIW